MSNESTGKETCNNCGRIIPKNRIILSSTNFRLCVNNIKDLDGLIKSKEYVVQFIENRHQHSQALRRRILDYLEDRIERLKEQAQLKTEQNVLEGLEELKLWLLDIINNIDNSGKEIYFYEYIQSSYSSIYETFTDFYDKYAYAMNEPLNKNQISRLLTALGLRTTVKKVNTPDGKSKCCVFLNVSEDKLSETLKKNRIN
jgi:hypothetical protein